MDRKKIERLDERIFADLEIKIEKELNKEFDSLNMNEVFNNRIFHNQLTIMRSNENHVINVCDRENELSKEVSSKPEKENNKIKI